MSSISLNRKVNRISSRAFTSTSSKEISPSPPAISIILTTSTASELNISARHLKNTAEDEETSKIRVLVNSPKKKFRSVSSSGLSDECGFFRLVPMQDSSTSVIHDAEDFLDMDLSLTPSKTNDQQKINLLYLRPYQVNTQSLMAVCSMAHSDKLSIDENNIFVSVPFSSSSNWVNKCRICYGTISNEELIRPCNCKGSIAFAHLSCLEHWLRESGRSYCELCKHNFQVVRTPKYGLLKSIVVWLSSPGEHGPLLVEDLISFSLYTPAAVCSTYILMLLSENALKNSTEATGHAANLITFFAFAGIAAIDFTYSSWLMMCLQRHLHAWRMWYRENCCLTLILPPTLPVPSNSEEDTTSEVD